MNLNDYNPAIDLNKNYAFNSTKSPSNSNHQNSQVSETFY